MTKTAETENIRRCPERSAPVEVAGFPKGDMPIGDFAAFIRDRTGFDFSVYLESIVMRRVLNRMRFLAIEKLGSYADYIRSHQGESQALCREILQSDTDFFRDGPVWARIYSVLIPQILSEKPPSEPMSIWSAGCSSGQEAYSIAMLLAEAFGTEGLRQRFVIEATDIDKGAVQRGRDGVYSEAEMARISSRRRSRFFDVTDRGWQIKPELQSVVAFRTSNILRPAAAQAFDFVLCRNTMTYMRPDTQVRLLEGLKTSLRAPGCLILGLNETTTYHDIAWPRGERFTTIDAEARIYCQQLQSFCANNRHRSDDAQV